MSSNPNDKVFVELGHQIGIALTQQLDASLHKQKQTLRQFLDRYASAFFQSLVRHNLGDGPSYPGAPKWGPLAGPYQDSKYSAGYREGFYERTGSLESALLGQSAIQRFGRPEITTKAEGSLRNSKHIFIDRAGRPQWRRSSGRRGFAPYVEAFSSLELIRTIKIFPKAQGKNPTDLLGAGTTGWATKLAILEGGRTRPNKMPARPLLRPFMNWYATKNLEETVLRKFKVRI
jgi:phage gpG-like protein